MYKNILLAVDLHPNYDHYDDYTTERAVQFAKECNANLYILHAVEGIHAYGAAQGYQIIIEVEKQIEEEATKALGELAEKFNIPVSHQILVKGFPKVVILEQAKKLDVDLIIVGLHSRHGLSLLFGTTADGVTHHAQCDVLEIKARD